MAVDFAVAVECAPKRYFGDGDYNQGTDDILTRLKSQNRAQLLRQMAEQNGQNPSEMTLTINVGNQTKKASLAELQAEAEPLREHEAACIKCPANLRDEPYGCFGVLNYPISESAEKWILGRLQPYGTVGANLCIQFLSEFRVTGQEVHKMRLAGFFESNITPKVVLKKGLLKNITVSSDQLFETILMSGNPLNPGHCFGLLTWLGAIKVQGKVPGGAEDQERLKLITTMQTTEEKLKYTELELGLGQQNISPDVSMLQDLMKALYISWIFDIPLQISI